MKGPNTGRRYDAAFREHAVELLVSSGKTIHELAIELGLAHGTLTRWKKQYLDQSCLQRNGQRITAADLEKEVQRLRLENEHLRRQRDILKKSLGILSEEPLQKGMPS
jgi:transposase